MGNIKNTKAVNAAASLYALQWIGPTSTISFIVLCVLLHAVQFTTWDPSFTCAPRQGQLADSSNNQ